MRALFLKPKFFYNVTFCSLKIRTIASKFKFYEKETLPWNNGNFISKIRSRVNPKCEMIYTSELIIYLWPQAINY